MIGAALPHIVILPLLAPLSTGILLVLLGGSATPLRRTVSMLGMQATFACAFVLVLAVSDGHILTYSLGNWPAPYGILLVADRLSALLVLLTSVLALLVMAHAIDGSDRRGRQFHVLFQFQIFGLNGAFLTGDLFNLFVFFEVLLIASYGLLLHGCGPGRARAGLHYVVVNLVGSALFLFAVGTLYGLLGTLSMAHLAERFAALPPAERPLADAAFLLLLLVFALKAALVPLHLWLPGAYASAGPAAAALFAIMTKVGAYAILRVDTLMLAPAGGGLSALVGGLLLTLGLVTVVAGTVGALASRGLAALVAYLALVSAGTLLAAFGIGGERAMAAGLYYILHSTLVTAALFLLTDKLIQTRGPYRDTLSPGPALPAANLLGGLFLVLALAAAGLPPFSGFIGKVLILQAGLETPWMAWILAVVLITSLLNLTALVRAGSVLFFKTGQEAGAATLPQPAHLVPVAALTAVAVLLVIDAGALLDFAAATAAQLAAPQGYVAAVLGEGAPPVEHLP